MPEAARIDDHFGHVSIWARLARVALRVATGMAEALIVGAAIVGVAALMATPVGWCGAIFAGGLIAGFIGGATGWSDYKEKKIKELTEDVGSPTITGFLTQMGSPDVSINNKAAARAVTDVGVCSQHSGPPIPIAEGSDSVWINTFPAARKGDKLQCSAKIVEGSHNVFIGGNKTAYLEVADDKEWWETALEIGIGLAMGRGSFGARLGCLGMGMLAGMAAEKLGRGFRSLLGYPVTPATGGKILTGEDDTDFALSGPMPIVWKRRYSSHDHRRDGMLGIGWSVEPYSVELRVFRAATQEELLVFVDEAGREVEMPSLKPGHGLNNVAEMITLGRTPGGCYEVTTVEGTLYQFGAPTAGETSQTLRLQRMRDRNGNWVACRHDGTQRLVNMADSLGRLLRFEYAETSPRVSAIHLEKGAEGEIPGTLVRYEYDSQAQLSAVISREGRVTRAFEYADSLMIRQEFAGGFSCAYAWESKQDATGPSGDRRVVRHWTSDGESYEISYVINADGTGGTTAVDQLGRHYKWSWDAHYNLTQYVGPLNEIWRLQWDGDRKLRSVCNPEGDEIKFQYNDHGMLVLEIDELGRTTRTLWDERWLEPLKITLPNGSSYRFEYDERGNNTVVIDPTGQETHYAYDRFGLPEAITDAKNGTKRLEWNSRAQLTSYTDCSNKTTRYSYDGWGYLKTITDAAGQQTRLTQDSMGRLLSVSQPDDSHQTYHHDAAGRPIGITDALSRTTVFTLNQRGQLLGRVDAEGRRVSLNYDNAQRLHSFVNENGVHFEFVYDAADRVVEERRVGGTRVLTEYDASGWPVAVIHCPGIGDEDLELGERKAPYQAAQPLRTEFVRDAAGRLIEKRTRTHHYHYLHNALDQLIEAKKLEVMDREGEQPVRESGATTMELRLLHRTCFEYDDLGNLAAELVIDEITGEQHALRHAHDELGNRIQTQLPVLAGRNELQRRLNYVHYGSGHLHQINLSQQCGDVPATHQVVSDIERDDLHREIARSQGKLTTRYSLDAMGRRAAAWCRPTSLDAQFGTRDAGWRQAIDSAGTSQSHVLDGLMKEYRYDPVGELRQSRHSLRGTSGHRYDATGRIEETVRAPLPGASNSASSVAANHEFFSYDPAGNLQDGGALGRGASAPSHGYVRDNLVRVFEDKRYVYDGHGRLIRKKSGKHTEQYFEWDDENHLVAVHTTRRPNTPEAATQITRFEYDALGRRVVKHDAFGSTRFIWEGVRLLEERRGAQVVSYVYEPDSYAPLARLDAWDEARDATTSNHHLQSCEVYYFHTDQAGLPEELSNTEGSLCWRASYRTWGAAVSERWSVTALDGRERHLVKQEEQPGVEQNLRFQGQYLDRDTGLHYNTFRFYDPDVGRFISPDPIGLAGGANLHVYAPNPIAWIDPWGWLHFPPGSPDLFPTTGGQRATVQITMQGSRSRDFTAAFKEAGIKKSQAKGYTWHHVDDFDPKTGKSTMQLVETDGVHKTTSHKGSVSQFEKHFGVVYDTEKAVLISQKKGWLTGRAPRKPC